MVVTLKQIREKRAELAKLNVSLVSAGLSLNAANAAKDTAWGIYEKLINQAKNKTSELRALGAEFAIDEGEDAIQETLNLPEQELPEIVESPFKPGAMSFGAAPLDDDIPF